MKKKVVIIIVSVLLVFALLFSALLGGFLYGCYSNDWNFAFWKWNKIVTEKELNKEYEMVVSHTLVADEAATDRAKLLYEAILANDSLTNAEKKEMAKFMQYFADNKYIDCDSVSQRLASFTITPNDPSLLNEGISAEYKEENTITFAADEDREWALSHELHHCIESENLPYDQYGWFGEGFTCLVNYEYMDRSEDSYNFQAFMVRGICEITGPEPLFEFSATGDTAVIENALVEKGIDESKVAETVCLFTGLKDADSYNYSLSVEQQFEAIYAVVDLYNIVHDYPDKIPYSLYKAAEHFLGMDGFEYEYYYLNSTKLDISDWHERYVPQTDVDILYEEALEYYSF